MNRAKCALWRRVRLRSQFKTFPTLPCEVPQAVSAPADGFTQQPQAVAFYFFQRPGRCTCKLPHDCLRRGE